MERYQHHVGISNGVLKEPRRGHCARRRDEHLQWSIESLSKVVAVKYADGDLRCISNGVLKGHIYTQLRLCAVERRHLQWSIERPHRVVDTWAFPMCSQHLQWSIESKTAVKRLRELKHGISNGVLKATPSGPISTSKGIRISNGVLKDL